MKPSVFPKLFIPGSLPGEERTEVEISMREFKRLGQEFLLLPNDSRAAERSLEVYAPQSFFARVAIKLLRRCLRLRIPFPLLRGVKLRIPRGSLLLSLLRKVTGDDGRGHPLPFALLAGNPREPNRRFVLLSFDQDHRPTVVMKIGVGRYSSELIERERKFIENHGDRFPCFPTIVDSVREEEFAVFCIQYLRINSLDANPEAQLYTCLSQWIHRESCVSLGDLPILDRNQDECAVDDGYEEIFNRVRDVQINPVISHGDLVPWNIRAEMTSEEWVVIDWERGEDLGVPAWDWFHFAVQTSILVHKDSPEAIMDRIVQLQAGRYFRDYAQECGIEDITSELFALYVSYFRHVLMHGRGGEPMDRLYEMAVERTGSLS